MDKVVPINALPVEPPPKKPGRLKRRLLGHTIATLLAGVAVTCTISIVLIQAEFPSWVRSTKDAMLAAEKASLQRVTAEKAAFTSEVLRRVQLDTRFWAGSLRDAMVGRGAAAQDAEVALAPALTRQGWTRGANTARDVAGWYAHGQTQAADCGGSANACRSWPPTGTFALWHNASRAAPFATSFKAVTGAGRDYDLVYAGLEDAAGSPDTLYLHYPSASGGASSSYDRYATMVYHCDRRSAYSASMSDAQRRAEWQTHVAAGNCADAAGACQRLNTRMNGGTPAGISSACAATCTSGRYTSADPCAGDGYCVSASGFCTNDATECGAVKSSRCSGCAKSSPPFLDSAQGRHYQKIGYDPRCRGWYQQAREQGATELGTSGARKVIFTSPYEFADGGMGMTAASALFEPPDPSWPSSPSAVQLASLRFLGVAAIDFSLRAVDKNVAGMSMKSMPSANGYMVASDGKVASHPKLDRATMLGRASLLRSVDHAPPAGVSEAWDGAALAMRDGCNATVEFSGRDDDAADKKWFLSYAPETTAMEAPLCAGSIGTGATSALGVPLWKLPGKGGLRSQGFAIGVSVSQSDVFAPIDQTERDINARLGASFAVLAVLLAVLLVGVGVFANALTNGVVKPVGELLRTVRELNAKHFDVELDGGQVTADSSPEMAAMMALFAKMACVVKFANVTLSAGNLESAAKTFREALEMFTALRNHKGMGVCRNNLGNVCLLQAHQAEKAQQAAEAASPAAAEAARQAEAYYAEAESFFRQACDDAELKLATMPRAQQVVLAISGSAPTGAVYQGATAVVPPAAAVAAPGAAAAASDSAAAMEEAASAFVKQLANRKHNLAYCLAAQARRAARACLTEGSGQAAVALQWVNATLVMLSQVTQLESALVATEGISGSGRPLGVATVHTNAPRAIDIKLEEVTMHETAARVLRSGSGADAATQAQGALAQADAALDAAQLLVDSFPPSSNPPPCVLQQRLHRARAARHWPACEAPPSHEEQERAAELFLRVVSRTAGAQIDVRAASAACNELIARAKTGEGARRDAALHSLAPEWERAAREALDKLQPHLAAVGMTAPPKDIVFVMDRSGSMAGGRMQTASENMLKVVDEFVDNRDGMGFVAFSELVHKVFDVRDVLDDTNRATLRSLMHAECNKVGGRTSFRDAVWSALEMLEAAHRGRHQAARPQYCVALTDGGDNMSRRGPPELMARLRGPSQDVVLIVIGLNIDGQTLKQTQALTDASKDGVYIDARDTSELAAAFAQVAALIQGPNLNVETY